MFVCMPCNAVQCNGLHSQYWYIFVFVWISISFFSPINLLQKWIQQFGMFWLSTELKVSFCPFELIFISFPAIILENTTSSSIPVLIFKQRLSFGKAKGFWPDFQPLGGLHYTVGHTGGAKKEICSSPLIKQLGCLITIPVGPLMTLPLVQKVFGCSRCIWCGVGMKRILGFSSYARSFIHRLIKIIFLQANIPREQLCYRAFPEPVSARFSLVSKCTFFFVESNLFTLLRRSFWFPMAGSKWQTISCVCPPAFQKRNPFCPFLGGDHTSANGFFAFLQILPFDRACLSGCNAQIQPRCANCKCQCLGH